MATNHGGKKVGQPTLVVRGYSRWWRRGDQRHGHDQSQQPSIAKSNVVIVGQQQQVVCRHGLKLKLGAA
jgi:hypothetical protein